MSSVSLIVICLMHAATLSLGMMYILCWLSRSKAKQMKVYVRLVVHLMLRMTQNGICFPSHSNL